MQSHPRTVYCTARPLLPQVLHPHAGDANTRSRWRILESVPCWPRTSTLRSGTEISYAASDKPALVALAETLDVPVPDRARAELESLGNSKTSRRMWTSVEVRKRWRIAAVVADIATAACKQVPACHEKGPGAMLGWLPATRSRSTAARRWPRRRFIVETVTAHPPNSLEARQALASLAHEPRHVVRAGVLKASTGGGGCVAAHAERTSREA